MKEIYDSASQHISKISSSLDLDINATNKNVRLSLFIGD